MSRPARPANRTDAHRALADLAREGVVDSVDLDAGKAVVRLGEILTPPIDWRMWVGDTTIWLPPTVGQPVTVTSPEGDIERAYISGGLSSSQMAPLFLGMKVGIRFKDGALITYDPEAKKLSFQLPGEAEITAPAGVKLFADTDIEGDVSIKGDVSIEGGLVATKVVEGKNDVIGGGKSLKGHRHTGVQGGSSISGAPQ